MEEIGEIRTKEGNKHVIYQGSCAIGEVIVSVFVLLDLFILHLNKWDKRTNPQLYFSIICSTPKITTTTTPQY